MKASELAIFLRDATKLIASDEPRGRLQRLALLLEVNGGAATNSLSKRIASLVPPTSHIAEPDAGRAATELEEWVAFLRKYGKPTLVKDLDALVAALGRVANHSIESISIELSHEKPAKSKKAQTSIRGDVVDRYVRVLETTLGDDPGFLAAHKQLAEDQNVTSSELTAIAKRFAFSSTKSKATALQKILSRHQLLMAGRAKLDATGGRIAG